VHEGDLALIASHGREVRLLGLEDDGGEDVVGVAPTEVQVVVWLPVTLT
jgi:hypothetical protein